MLDSLRYADRYVVRFDSVTHGDFYQFQRIAHPERAAEHVSYHIIARYTRAFLDAVLKEDAAATAFLRKDPDEAGAPIGFMTLEQRPAIPAAPTQEEFLLLVRRNEIAEARRAWSAFKEREPNRQIVSESALTTVSFFLRRDRGPRAALGAFRLLADIFPASWRAREHLGTTYRQAGNEDQALSAYHRALHLLQKTEMSSAERNRHEARLDALLEEWN